MYFILSNFHVFFFLVPFFQVEVKEYNERADASDEETFFYSPLEVAMVKQRISTNF